ncbi:response regulator [Crateriforma conspicua]|uniref:hypothetical protein n=1 Tax=Crateriforma conspicua TaxID=2527996 RepID=UPI0011883922|nr:hypothetical protein [Crateriforma conspicua]QDV63145.1 hypothetical protein Mal65_22870 [Crateriforma conspicua]
MRRTPISAQADRTESRSASITVIDPSPLSLLALAGVLDAEGWKCVCGRNNDMAVAAMDMGPQDLFVFDVGDDAAAVLDTLAVIRGREEYEKVPAVLLAESQWAGLEKQIESLPVTRCLFKPIDPPSLVAVVQQLLWMPGLVEAHRRRGSRPSRPGWVNL